MKIDLDVRTFLPFTLCFIAFTIIGTLSHELGHLFVAKALGYETILHYGSMSWNADGPLDETHYFLILCGGTLQTMLTGSIGFALLVQRRHKKRSWGLLDYFLTYLVLFWSRPVFNVIISSVLGFMNSTSLFGGDEAKMSLLLDLPEGFFSLLFGTLGVIFCSYTVFILLPKKQRFTFIVSGLYGGLSGYGLWMKTIGPLLLP